MRAPAKLYLASSNSGKLAEYRTLSRSDSNTAQVTLELLPDFDSHPAFEETAPTFAENAAGKALHYSRFCQGPVFADDSGLVVPALGGAPGVLSARYAGPGASTAARNAKLLAEMHALNAAERAAHFVCAIALANGGRTQAVVTGRLDGEILNSPRGEHGFGYDPVFYLPTLNRSLAELSIDEKNGLSHRGQAFRKLLAFLSCDTLAGE